jgi:hypothetical protein
MEAKCSSEKSVDTQRTTRRYIPEDGTQLVACFMVISLHSLGESEEFTKRSEESVIQWGREHTDPWTQVYIYYTNPSIISLQAFIPRCKLSTFKRLSYTIRHSCSELPISAHSGHSGLLKQQKE